MRASVGQTVVQAPHATPVSYTHLHALDAIGVLKREQERNDAAVREAEEVRSRKFEFVQEVFEICLLYTSRRRRRGDGRSVLRVGKRQGLSGRLNESR